ncbi:lipid transfer protein 6 [Arabidopsis thaliana]|uniref:Non-specific lipid-transfer protein n=1 Tax=Arabidopsis thaliana TaxID=3702 RepID=F4IXC6_ARATH|nr:lipid transfer protein 6 [Arabidopsis thaliana]AEE74677.1 lipid transfer protein 6 [Arabidopsis thaliana]|eukprot:NP_001189842.1 lipid transfer protein 6 [Arabidopsis thaliana]
MRSLLLAVCLVLALHCGEAAVSCNTVIADLYPCLSYVTQGGPVPTLCCNGLTTLKSQAQTSVDRQGVCRCIKSAIGGLTLSPRTIQNALELPSKCGVDLPYKFSPSTDCDSETSRKS